MGRQQLLPHLHYYSLVPLFVRLTVKNNRVRKNCRKYVYMKQAFFFGSILLFILTSARPAGNRYDFSAVDKYVEGHTGVYDNSVAILVSLKGEEIYRKESGLDIHTPRVIASASKWLSGAVIMSLVDEGKLSLHDTVGRFLPIFTRYGKGHVTIRQLFSHTSGFPGDSPQRYEYSRDLTLAAAVDSLAVNVELINKPGSTFNYGSVGMHIAGRIAEIISGRSWQSLFNEKIAHPCRMEARYILMNPRNPLIAGGVRTSARDYLNFLEMIANNGVYNGKRVLSASSITAMLTDQTNGAVIDYTPYMNCEVRYGIGNWRDVIDKNGVLQEVSSPGAFGTHPWVDLKHHAAGIIFTRTKPTISNKTSIKIREMVRNVLDGKPAA